MATTESWLWCFRAGVGFILLAGLLFMLGFTTDHWVDDDTIHYGLWETCSGATCSAHEADDLSDYHIATQALQIVALFCFAVGPILHLCFYLSKKYKETGWRSRIFDVLYSIGMVMHLTSVVVFGVEHPNGGHLSWSYRMTAAAAPISIMGITFVIISRSKALVRFQFRTNTKSSRKKKVGVLVDSRSSTPQSYSGRRSVRENLKRKEARNGEGLSREINVNVTITNPPPPPPPGGAFATPSSSKMPYPEHYGFNQQGMHNHPSASSSSTASPSMGAFHVAAAAAPDAYHQNDLNAYASQDPTLTTVLPAPSSSSQQPSHNHGYVSPPLQFGPSEKQRVLNPSDNHHDLGPIRGRPIPSAPPHFSDSQHGNISTIPGSSPPPYSDAISPQGISDTKLSEEDSYKTSVV